VRGHCVRAGLWATEPILVSSGGAAFYVPVIGAPLTWVGMATAIDVADLVALGDAMLTQGAATEQGLSQAVASWGDGRGAQRLRAAVTLLRRGAESRPESLLRLQIQRAGLPEPAVNVPVIDRRGRRLFRPDLSWPEYRVLVEYEGDIHRLSQRRFRSDITRMEQYADAGWHGLRAVADDVFETPDVFLKRLQRRLLERGLRPRELTHVPAATR
jgi:hypothetical protein